MYVCTYLVPVDADTTYHEQCAQGVGETCMTKETAVPGTQHAPLRSQTSEKQTPLLSASPSLFSLSLSLSLSLSRLTAATPVLALAKAARKKTPESCKSRCSGPCLVWNAKMLRGLGSPSVIVVVFLVWLPLKKLAWLTAGTAADARWTPRDQTNAYLINQVVCMYLRACTSM